MSIKAKLPPIIERHELKYTIPYSFVEPITQFLEIYCDLDHYSSISEDNFYQVNSLYFDTRGLEFLKQRLFGKNGRFKVRVRCYGNGDKAPYFLEIKRKRGFSGMKFRATAREDEWPSILTNPGYRVSPQDSERERHNKELFSRISCSYAIEPKLLTQYQRRAFISSIEEYARVTMDTKMRYREQEHYSLVPNSDMKNYDNETIYSNSYENDASVILELKCNIGHVPKWMLDLISVFNLKQQGFSKYANSSIVSYFDDGISYSRMDRVLKIY